MPVSSTALKQAVELRCADAGSGSGSGAPNGANVAAGGLTLEDLALPNSQLPRATELNFRVPTRAAEQHFRKTPADVVTGAGPVTVELLESTDGAALMWVSADQWSSSLDARRWMTTKVTFDGCPHRDVTYFGGLFAPAPDSCLHLRIRPSGVPATDRRLRLDGNPC